MNPLDSTRFGDGHNPWVILPMLFTIHVMTAIGLFSISPLIPLIKHELDLNHAQVGLLSGSFFFGRGFNFSRRWLGHRFSGFPEDDSFRNLAFGRFFDRGGQLPAIPGDADAVRHRRDRLLRGDTIHQ